MGRERISRYSTEAVEFAYSVMTDRVVCTVCEGTGKSPVHGKGEKIHDRKCQSCKGRGREIVDPRTRLEAAKEIMDRGGVPKQKQTDHISSDGTQRTGLLVAFIEERGGKIISIDSPAQRVSQVSDALIRHPAPSEDME